jgi:hypothetical protein
MSLQHAKIGKAQRNLLIGFMVLSALLLLLILYFSLTKTIIEVVVRPETATLTTSVVVQDASAPSGSAPDASSEPATEKIIPGRVLSITATKSKTSEGSSTGSLVDDYAVGTVTLVNQTSRAQPLVQTTRLLSTEGVLFRTQETVSVPAGGTVTVVVKADQPGKEGNIGPSRFTIVALWPGLQEKIFGTSEVAMEGGVKEKRQLVAADFSAATQQLMTEIKEEAFRELSTLFVKADPASTLRPDAISLRVLSEKTDHEIGDESESFTTTIEVQVTGVVFSDDALVELVTPELTSALAENETLLEDSVIISGVNAESLKSDLGRANLQITTSGQTIPTLAHPMFDRKELTNKDQQDIRAAFSRFDNVETVNVHFSPFWVFRTPALEDHIEIEIVPQTQLTNQQENDTLGGDANEND